VTTVTEAQSAEQPPEIEEVRRISLQPGDWPAVLVTDVDFDFTVVAQGDQGGAE
jgi:hypothetical protein